MPSEEHVDVVVVGMGPGGEAAAGRLTRAGRSVAVVERELIGGECAYWACIPSKTMLAPARRLGELRRGVGLGEPAVDWEATREHRDDLARHLDDAAEAQRWADRAEVVRGDARFLGPGRVQVGARLLLAAHVIVATGSEPVVPPVDGLDEVAVWTNREATTFAEVPESAIVLGAGPVGVELGQLLARHGCRTTIVEMAPRVLPGVPDGASALLADVLEADGVDLRCGRRAERARRSASGARIDLDDGSTLDAAVVVAATGRRPRTAGLDLDRVGIELDEHGAIPVDDRLRAADGVWAVGDVTGVLPFTHVASYQGRVAAADLLGEDVRASYEGVPRVTFTDPDVAVVGLDADAARQQGVDVAVAELELAEALARPVTESARPVGAVGVVVDRSRRRLVGAWAAAPGAAEWIHQPAMAIRHGLSVDALVDDVAQFPTWSEAWGTVLARLDLEPAPRPGR
jgi:dihydrolipoamide dehydrogenase